MLDTFIKYLTTVVSFLRYIVSLIPVMIYNMVYSRYFTISSYKHMATRWNFKKQNIKSILDVGVGTGHPLHSIINQVPAATKVLGIDIDRNYIAAAVNIFKKNPNVSIKEMNYYAIAKTAEKFDVIIFSSSFMILPYREKALEIAKSHLNQGGKIYFLMTLFKHKGLRQKMISYIKPYLKYLTTIEFG